MPSQTNPVHDVDRSRSDKQGYGHVTEHRDQITIAVVGRSRTLRRLVFTIIVCACFFFVFFNTIPASCFAFLSSCTVALPDAVVR